MPAISVTMAYYNRPGLLRNTLWAYRHLHDDLSDVEFVIVDDQSEPGLEASPVVEELGDALNVRVLQRVHKVGRNPAVPINASVRNASGDIVIVTNPETMPITPVLDVVREFSGGLSRRYAVASCYSVSEVKQGIIDGLDPSRPGFVDEIRNRLAPQSRAATFDGDDGWYEHPTFLARGLYFCAAMRRDDFVAVGGIDEDFSAGNAWEDTDFLRRLAENGFEMGHLPGAVCLHQHHYTSPASKKGGPGTGQDNSALYERKAALHVLVANQGREWGVL